LAWRLTFSKASRFIFSFICEYFFEDLRFAFPNDPEQNSDFHLAFPVRPVVTLVPVILPLERLKIAEIVCAAFGDRHYVVNLPAELNGLTVLAALHRSAALVLPERWIVWLGRALPPYRLNSRLVKGTTRRSRAWIARRGDLLS
jgi:hypothetical protein